MILFYFQRCVRKLILSFLFVCSACSSLDKQEARIVEKYPAPKFKAQNTVAEDVFLIDARPYYQYASHHLDRAYHQDVALYQDTKYYDKLSRSLARKGLKIDSEVLVLGEGSDGSGEECRIALGLFVMGVTNVSFIREDYLKGKRLLQEVLPPKESQEFFTLKLNDDFITKEVKDRPAWLIDVRSKKEYLKGSLTLELDTLNIPWQEFLEQETGQPKKSLPRHLKQMGVDKTSTIYVYDGNNLSGACAVLALWSWGYQNAKYLQN